MSNKPHKPLKPIYLISGDVPLLIQEARDHLRQRALPLGFTQREILTVEPGFNWETLHQPLRNRNLFSEKILIDLRLAKWEEAASKALLEYAPKPANDILLIISTAKLTSAQQKTKWYKAIATAGETMAVWPVTRYELPQWIQRRLHANKIQTDQTSIQLLADWTEGNLLATQQAIEKLQLLYPEQPITQDKMLNVLNDSARFTVFDLSNAALQGDKKRTSRILSQLIEEDMEPTRVLWALSREVRQLVQLFSQQQQGASINQLIQKEWHSRKPLIKAALQRQSYRTMLLCLQNASQIDCMIKGLKKGDHWKALESFALCIAGSGAK